MAGGFPVRRLAVLLATVLFGGIASAAATNWQSVGVGDWFLGTNWDAGTPNATSTAVIGNGGTAQVGAGSANASVLHIGAALNNAQSGTAAVLGGSLTAPTISVGTGTTNTNGASATGTGTLQMFDAIFSSSTLLQVGVGAAPNKNNSVTATGVVTLSGGTAAIDDLVVGSSSAFEGSSATVDASLVFEDVAFTGTGLWTIGSAAKTGGDGSRTAATVNQAQVVIGGNETSTVSLSGLSIGIADARQGTAQTNASLSFTGESLTTTTLSLGTAHGRSYGTAQVQNATATFDADLIVTGNASVGAADGVGDGSYASVANTILTVEAGHRLDVGGALTVGSADSGQEYGESRVANPRVVLEEGTDFRVGGLLTVGQAYNSGTGPGDDGVAIVENASLEQDGGSASLNGGMVVGRATSGRAAGATASASILLDGTSLTGSGAWTIGEAIVPSSRYEGNALVSDADVQILGDGTSNADLTSVVVGRARSSGEGTAQVTAASLTYSGGTFATDALSVGVAAAETVQDNQAASTAGATFSDGTAAIGDLVVGSASAFEGSSATVDASLVFEDVAFTGTGLWTVGAAAKTGRDGYRTTAAVNQAEVVIDGRDTSTANLSGLSIGSASATQGAAQTNASFSFAGQSLTTTSLSLGTAQGGPNGTAQVQNATATLDADLIVTGDAGIGLSYISAGSDASGAGVENTLLTVEAGNRFDVGGALVIGKAGSNADYGGATATNSGVMLKNGVDFRVGGLLTIGQAYTERARDDGWAMVEGAYLEQQGGSASLEGGLVIGAANAGSYDPPVQAAGAAIFRNTNVSVRSLKVGQYTGVGELNPSSFAHGSLTLADSIMTVDEDAELAYLTAGVGSATAELSLTRSLLDVEGNLLLGAGSELLFQIDGYDEYGRIEAGTASLDGDLTVAFDFILTETGYWDLIALDDGSSFAGDFDSGEVLGLSAGTIWSLGFATNDFGQVVYRLAITGVSPAPVSAPAPGAIGLLSLGAGIALAHRRRG